MYSRAAGHPRATVTESCAGTGPASTESDNRSSGLARAVACHASWGIGATVRRLAAQQQQSSSRAGRAQLHMTPGPTGQAGTVDPTGQVVVTLKDVWFAQQDTTAKLTGAVQDINLNLTRILGHVEAQTGTNADVSRQLADHESRMRALERWRYALPTAVLLGLGSAVGTVIAWLQVIHH